MDIKFVALVIMIHGFVFGEDDLRRTNAGVIFKSMGTIQSSSSVWYHTFAVDLPSLPGEWKHFPSAYPTMIAPNCSTGTSRTLCKSPEISMPNFIVSISAEVARTLEKIIRRSRSTIPVHAPLYQERMKRSAPLSFIGSLSETIFGTATVDDVERVAAHVNELIRRERLSAKTLVAHEENFQSFIKLNNKRFNVLKGIASDNHNLLKQLREIEINNTRQMSKKNYLNSLALTYIRKVKKLVQHLDDIDHAITDLAQGYLSPLLVSDKEVARVVRKINRKLADKRKAEDYRILSANTFRTQKSFFVLLQGNTILVTMKFQVGQIMRKSHLYQVLTYPVPTSKHNNHATKIAGLPEYVIISDAQVDKQYTTMTSAQHLECQGRHHFICPYSVFYQSISRKTCLASLIRDSVDDINEYCDFRYFRDHLEPYVEWISENNFLVYGIPRLDLDVDGEIKEIKGCHFCILTIPCNSRITVDDLTSDRVLSQGCIEDNSKVSHKHLVNLAIIKEFGTRNNNLDYRASTVFQKEQNIELPNFDFYEHRYQDFITAEKESNLKLKEIIKASNAQKKVFQSISEPLIKTTEENASWFGINMNIVDVILFVGAVVLTIYVFKESYKDFRFF